MQAIAHIKEIWHYPVKSMGGESIDQTMMTPSGLVGDRLWAVVDADGEIKTARQWPKLIEMKARHVNPPALSERVYKEQVPDATISIPGQAETRSRCAEASAELERFLGKECRLEALRSPSDSHFYKPPKERNIDNLDQELDKLEGEANFDFSQTPAKIFEILGQYMTPPGMFVDTFALHMISTQSLAYLQSNSQADVDRKRFRPNLLLDFVDSTVDKPEFELLGKRIHIGDTVIHIQGKTIRCSIPSRPQPLHGLSQDPKMTRAMVDLFERHIGVYANIERGGEISVGDPVWIET